MPYVIKSYADALIPKPKIGYLVDRVLQAGSISIWYGYPGSLKSNLVLDMAMAVAVGAPWLPARPGSTDNFAGYSVMQTPVIWIDIDNGEDVIEERVRAFGTVYGANAGTPFFYMPYPNVRAISSRSMLDLTDFILQTGLCRPFIVLDTLLRAAKVKDENSSEMDTVMYNLHKMAEDLKATLAMISHSNKVNNGRAGNALRGHSSIEGGVDYVFRIKRDGNADIIDIENEKARRKPINPFLAQWTYDTDPVSDELIKARFYHADGIKISKQQQMIDATCQLIIDTLKQDGKMNKSTLYSKIKGKYAYFETALVQAVHTNKVTETPNLLNNQRIYEAN